jgi:D-arginine dehydrogenase
MSEFDILIIGAGMAGASIAAHLAEHKSVLLLEAEDRPGYHATGRSAAFWTESYGGPLVQPLTAASGPFLSKPPAEFSDRSFLRNRGALYLGTKNDQGEAEQMLVSFAKSSVELNAWDAAAIRNKLPEIRPEWDHGIWEPSCADIDVAALHAAYLRQAEKHGAKLLCNAQLSKADWRNGAWAIQSNRGNFGAKIVINAAGAWADEVATKCGVTPVGIQPFRRTILQLALSPTIPDDVPLVIGLDGSFYFKSAGQGQIWLSPHDETPSPPCDVAPEEIDVAQAIARLEQVMDWRVNLIVAKWAGLRSFAPDRLPVIGQDTDNPHFFWFAGQGGFGIQTAPAAAALATSLLIEGQDAPVGIIAETFMPQRFD